MQAWGRSPTTQELSWQPYNKLERVRERVVLAEAAGVGQGWTVQDFFSILRAGRDHEQAHGIRCAQHFREGTLSWIPRSWIPLIMHFCPHLPPKW